MSLSALSSSSMSSFSSSSSSSIVSSSQKPGNKTQLHGLQVAVIYKMEFEEYVSDVKDSLTKAYLSRVNSNRKAALYAVAGIVLLVAAAAIFVYLRATVSPTYVWPGQTKLLTASGITGLIMGGLFSLGMADRKSQRASGASFISRILDARRADGNISTFITDESALHFPT